MNVLKLILFSTVIILTSCQSEDIEVGTSADDTFYVTRNNFSMRVTVKGNTASRKIMLIIHGGPGGSAYFYRTREVKEMLEPYYAVAYWDQRAAGASQGTNNNNTVHLNEYGEDLAHVIKVLKHRYGAKIYLMSQSWGGMVATQFLTTPGYQQEVSGWIFANAVHDWPLNDQNSVAMLMSRGKEELAKERNVSKWTEIIKYCESLNAPYTSDQSGKLNNYAWDAMNLIEGFDALNEDKILKDNLIAEKIPFTAAFSNLANPANRKLLKEIVNISFTDKLSLITVPVLICAGKHDFVCPQATGDNLFKNLGSTDKQQMLFNNSGHNLEQQSLYVNAFRTFVDEH